MDGVSALVDGPRAQRAFALKAVFDGSVVDHGRGPCAADCRGDGAWSGDVHRHITVRQRWVPGDVVLVRGPAPYTFADTAQTPEDIRILPGQVCVDPNGRLLAADMELGLRTWGNTRSDDATVMLIGTYQQETSVGSLLLSKLPVELVIRDLEPALIGLFAQEIVGDEPGQVAVIDRLLDLLVVRCVRTVLATWAGPSGDDLVGRALRAIEEQPEHAWTVESLATRVGLSRAALARRFTCRWANRRSPT